MQILALVVLSFYHFEGSFPVGVVLRPFCTCSSFMSFSPFSCFLWLLFLSGCFFFSVLFSLGRRRAPLSLLCATFSCFCFVFVFVFCWAVFHPALSLLVLFAPVC